MEQQAPNIASNHVQNRACLAKRPFEMTVSIMMRILRSCNVELEINCQKLESSEVPIWLVDLVNARAIGTQDSSEMTGTKKLNVGFKIDDDKLGNAETASFGGGF